MGRRIAANNHRVSASSGDYPPPADSLRLRVLQYFGGFYISRDQKWIQENHPLTLSLIPAPHSLLAGCRLRLWPRKPSQDWSQWGGGVLHKAGRLIMERSCGIANALKCSFSQLCKCSLWSWWHRFVFLWVCERRPRAKCKSEGALNRSLDKTDLFFSSRLSTARNFPEIHNPPLIIQELFNRGISSFWFWVIDACPLSQRRFCPLRPNCLKCTNFPILNFCSSLHLIKAKRSLIYQTFDHIQPRASIFARVFCSPSQI